jgi:hypothetical protein
VIVNHVERRPSRVRTVAAGEHRLSRDSPLRRSPMRLGVLTRDPALLGDVQVAQLIDAGHLPPIAELLAMDDRGELP